MSISAGVPVRTAAAHFHVTEKTIYRWIHSGLLDAERVGPQLLRVDLNSIGTPVGGVAE